MTYNHDNVIRYPSPRMATEGERMVKQVVVGFDELNSVLAYDAETGAFTWRVMVGTKGLAGSPAGSWFPGPNGKKYFSITYKGRKMSAAQVAWFLTHKEWPDRSVFFIDDNPGNLRLSNLKKADYKSLKYVDDNGVTRYSMHKEQARHYGLQRYYNVTMPQYAEMFKAQNGLCAICNQPETAKIPGRKNKNFEDGRTRDLSVDHDHTTGAVRQLLCNACNHILGEAGDDANRLRAAADYLDFHRKALKDAC